MNTFVRWLRHWQQYADRPWYAPLVATSATLDYFVLASPAQSLFYATVLLNPKRRFHTAICFSLAAALGAMLLAAGAQVFGTSLVAMLPEDLGAFGQRAQAWMSAWGVWALIGLSVIPVPLRTVVILAALSGLSFPLIGLAVLLGRLPAFLLLGQLVGQTPRFAQRIPWVRRFVARLHAQSAPTSLHVV